MIGRLILAEKRAGDLRVGDRILHPALHEAVIITRIERDEMSVEFEMTPLRWEFGGTVYALLHDRVVHVLEEVRSK